MKGLAQRQLVVVTGKGGVGKTTLAACLGRLLAAQGRRVMLLEVDPRQNLHHLLGVPPTDGAIAEAGDRLWLQNLQPRGVLEDLVRQKLKVAALSNRVIASPIFQHFADGAPGLKEMALLGHALRLARGDLKLKVDTVVLDAPATGHSVSLLAAPLVVSEVIEKGPVGALAREVAEFVADQKRVAVVIAALAEEMPVQETLELIALLEARLGRPPELVVVNGLYPALPRLTTETPRGAEAAMDLWRQRRSANDRELARLRDAWKGPLLELPLLPMDRGAELVAALTETLAGAWANGRGR